MRIQWARSAGISWKLKSGNIYGLLRVDAIGNEMYIIGFHFLVGALSSSDLRREEQIGVAETKDFWTSEFFYMTEFSVDSSEDVWCMIKTKRIGENISFHSLLFSTPYLR